MSEIRMSNAIARRYFSHAGDESADGTQTCYFCQQQLNEDGWGFWVESNGRVVVDETSANGELPSRKIIDECVRSAVKFLAKNPKSLKFHERWEREAAEIS